MTRHAFSFNLGLIASPSTARSALPALLILAACTGESKGADGPTGSALADYTAQCPTATVEGVDVYDGQGTIDWAQVKASGRGFAFIKASQGDYNTQKTFAANWTGAKANGVLRSAYHFFDATVDGVTQAEHFLTIMGPLDPDDLPPMLDIECPTASTQAGASANCEYTGNSGWAPTATVIQRIQDWISTVEAATGRSPILYSYPAWFGDVGVTAATFSSYPLFIATYGSCASVPAPWTNAMFWQYSASGTVPGISGKVDVDRFIGTAEDLAALTTPPMAVGAVDALQRTDIDGDGKADLCGRGNSGFRCYLSTGTAFGPGLTGPATSDANGWSDASNYDTLRMLDFTGDGKADLCARANAGIVCWPWAGTGFGAMIVGPDLPDASGWSAPQYYTTIRVADVNGDGKDDLCIRSPTEFRCYPSNGAGFDAAILGPPLSDDLNWSSPQYYDTLRMGDVDGDGRDDVCARDATGMHCWLSTGSAFGQEVTGPAWSDATGWDNPSYHRTIRLLDVDGDGRADLCARSVAGLTCSLSKGTSFGAPIAGPAWSDANGWSAPSSYTTIRFGDLNGDHALDVCARSPTGIVCRLWTGNGFSPTDIVGPALSDTAGWTGPSYYGTIELADVTGDGRADLCARGPAGVECWPSTGKGFGTSFIESGMSDAAGWGAAEYYTTLRVQSRPTKRPAVDGGASGGGGAGAAGAGGTGGGATGFGAAGGGGVGTAGAGPTPSATKGCGCRTAGGEGSHVPSALACVALTALALKRRRQQARSRAPGRH